MKRTMLHIHRKFMRSRLPIHGGSINHINPKVVEAISLYVSLIKSAFPESICQVVLFGSYVRGEGGPESDVDIMVIATDDTWETEYRLITMGYRIFLEMGVFLSVKVRTQGEFNQSGNIFFLDHVKKEGVVVG